MDKVAVQDNRRMVVMHNYLINGRFNLTTLEIRAFLYMLSEIKPRTGKDAGDTEFKLCKIPVTAITDSVGGKTYTILRKFNDELSGKRFSVEEIIDAGKNKGKRRYTSIPIFSKISFVERAGYIEGLFNPEMKPYLLSLSGNFTKTELQFLLELKNVNTLRIYLLLKERMDFGERTIKYDELKSMLHLSDKYSKACDFKRKVLAVAMADLADSDMAFEIESIKSGRDITSFRFILTKDRKVLQESKRPTKKLTEQSTRPQQGSLFNQQPAPGIKYTKVSPIKQNLKATSKLNIAELKEMHRDDYDSAIAARLKGGWYWNEAQTIMYKD